MIFGPPRVGKSSLFKVLRGKIPKKDSKSTGVCNRLMFKVAITKDATGSKSTWHKIKIKDEISRLQSKLQEKQKLSNLTKEGTITVGASQHVLLDVEKNMVENVANQNQSYSEMKYTATLMVCYDSGGQPEFFDIMPSLATNPTGYVMVIDMSKDLSQPIKSEAFLSNNKVTLPDEVISIDLLKNAIASIQSSSSNTSLHNLLVVGTHLDQCKNPEKKIPKLDHQIYSDLVKGDAESLFRDRRKNKSQRKIDCTQIVHPIANLIECTDSIPQGEITESRDRDDVAQEIRTAIENMANNDNIRKEIPINWLLFQLETQLKVTENNYIARKTCVEYAEKCYIKKDEIDHVLSYFHELGIILYYKEAAKDIVFSPQWLFDRLSDIIFEKYNGNFKEDIKKGRIKKEFLVDIYRSKIDVNGPLTVDQLLQVFIDQNIMARFPEDEDLFFMPALLSPDPDRLVNAHLTLPESSPFLTECGKRSCERLYIKFENRYFPRGLFCSLAWFIQDNPRHNNILVFQLPHSADEYIGLFDCQTNLAVEMYQENNKDPSISPHKISELLYQFLKVFCKKSQFDSNFKFGFTCKRKGCNHFAAVQLKYPFLPEKSCKRCGKSKLNYDELIWMTSPKDLTDILSAQVSVQM